MASKTGKKKKGIFEKIRQMVSGETAELYPNPTEPKEIVLSRFVAKFIGASTHYMLEAEETVPVLKQKTICGQQIFGGDVPVRIIKDGAVLMVTCKKCRSILSDAEKSGVVKIARVKPRKVVEKVDQRESE